MTPDRWFDRKRVLVTGGASFIGSHLVEALVASGAQVRVADDLSSGTLANLDAVRAQVETRVGDLKHWTFAAAASQGCEIVFHLAANHGGRGYLAKHPASCATNMALDAIVFETAVANGVDRIIYASSACVYPTDIQRGRVRLREDMVSFDERGGAFADETYGWAKLMGELSLRAFHRQFGTKGCAARIFTAYGPRENESHALVALIAKAFVGQSPLAVWGDGEQTRNFTYVTDIVRGLLLAAQHVTDASAVNVGVPDFISLNQAAAEVFHAFGWEPPAGIRYLEHKPVGVRHRAADLERAKRVLRWEPQVSFREGVRATVDWYRAHHDLELVRAQLEHLLEERSVVLPDS